MSETEYLSMNERLRRANIVTVETGRKTVYGMPEKALTNGVVSFIRPKYEECEAMCRELFGIEI